MGSEAKELEDEATAENEGDETTTEATEATEATAEESDETEAEAESTATESKSSKSDSVKAPVVTVSTANGTSATATAENGHAEHNGADEENKGKSASTDSAKSNGSTAEYRLDVDSLVTLLGNLATDASHRKSKNDKLKQRSVFRDVLKTVEVCVNFRIIANSDNFFVRLHRMAKYQAKL